MGSFSFYVTLGGREGGRGWEGGERGERGGGLCSSNQANSPRNGYGARDISWYGYFQTRQISSEYV